MIRSKNTLDAEVVCFMPEDVPSPIDLRDFNDAREWERTALSKRPSRPNFFEVYAEQICLHSRTVATVLELGSGPGFLAEHLLTKLPHISYTALDFSRAMHELARARLGETAERVGFVEGNFKYENWAYELGQFDCVVTHQAVHELRHKRHATQLHGQIAMVLPVGGLYLVCDHFSGSGGMADDQLFMTQEEQKASLIAAGFEAPELLKTEDTLSMYRAVR